MTSARHVWELSRAILGDQDGLVVVIRIYMDESGIHDGSPYVTVGAHAGRPKHWKAFTTEWNAKKRPYGVKVYHAADCASQWGEFKGWDQEKTDEFAKTMLPIIPKHPPVGVAIGIDMAAYEEAMRPHPELREVVGTPYGCCFHWTVQIIMNMIEGHGANDRLAFFHEHNDFETEALKSFNWIKDHRRDHHAEMTITFGSKHSFVLLQAADILAYEANKGMQGIDAGRPPRRSWTALDPDEKRLMVKRYGKDNMPWFIQRLKDSVDEIKTFGRPVTFLDD